MCRTSCHFEYKMNGPQATATNHVLPFDKLSADDFERLCLWLITDLAFTNVQHLGDAGSDMGRDLVAERDGHQWVFQCKRVASFAYADAQKELSKLASLPDASRTERVVFLVTASVSAKTRQKVSDAYRGQFQVEFWAATELDERVK